MTEFFSQVSKEFYIILSVLIVSLISIFTIFALYFNSKKVQQDYNPDDQPCYRDTAW